MDDHEATNAALQVIVRALASSALSAFEPGEWWEEWPLIGEYDWERICELYNLFSDEQDPTTAEVDAAYEHLQARAKAVD